VTRTFYIDVRKTGLRLAVRVSVEDYDRVVAAGPWFVGGCKTNRTRYVQRNVCKNGVWTVEKLHRFILGVQGRVTVDHVDCDGLNNTRENLRQATYRENSRNVALTSRNTSGFKGVSWHKGKQTWTAQIRDNGVLHALGSFPTPELAHAAYCAAAPRVHGEFARTA
jgi:hypothetical protein